MLSRDKVHLVQYMWGANQSDACLIRIASTGLVQPAVYLHSSGILHLHPVRCVGPEYYDADAGSQISRLLIAQKIYSRPTGACGQQIANSNCNIGCGKRSL